MTTLKLTVVSFQINIDVGDASIHLLVDASTKPSVVYNAILIDGGKPTRGSLGSDIKFDENFLQDDSTIEGKGLQGLSQCIALIEKEFVFSSEAHFDPFSPASTEVGKNTQGKAAKLRFDAVVVTHWDDDHWGGIRDLLYRDILGQIPSAQTEKSDNPRYFTGLECNYFKYRTAPAPIDPFDKSGGGTALTFNDLLTTFYAPYMGGVRYDDRKPPRVESGTQYRVGPPPSDYKSRKKRGKSALEEKKDDKSAENTPFFFCNNIQNPDAYKSDRTNTLGIAIEIPKDKDTLVFYFRDLCKLVASYDEYLGTELFQKKVLEPNTWQSIASPNLLLQKHGLNSAAGTRMYIVAGDQVVIGNTKLAPNKTLYADWNAAVKAFTPATTTSTTNTVVSQGSISSSTAGGSGSSSSLGGSTSPTILHTKTFNPGGVRKVVDERRTVLGDGNRVSYNRGKLEKNKSEEMNSASIVCLVFSREQSGWQLWHYLAGDALWDVESAVAAWLKQDKGVSPNTKFMKLSHHAASPSTPVQLIQTLTPQTVLISCGSDKGYGHPRPEILIYFLAMQMAAKEWTVFSNAQWTKIFALNWPVWFHEDTDATFSLGNLDQLNPNSPAPTEKSSAEAVFLWQLRDAFRAGSFITGGPKSLLDQWWDLPDSKKKKSIPKTAQPAYRKGRVQNFYGLFKHYWGQLSSGKYQTGPWTDKIIAMIATMDTGEDPVLTTVWRDAGNIRESIGPEKKPSVATLKAPTATIAPPDKMRDEGEVEKRLMDCNASSTGPKRQKATVDVTSDPTEFEEDIDDGDEEGGYNIPNNKTIDPTEWVMAPADGSSSGGGKMKLSSNKRKEVSGEHAVHTSSPSTNHAPSTTSVAISNLGAAASASYYLCGADFGTFAPRPDAALLEPGTLNDFIATLASGCVKLVSAWSSDPSTSSNPIALSNDDEWMERLSINGIGITTLSLAGHVDGQVARVSNISATLNILNAQLLFDTDSTKIACFPPPTTNSPTPTAASIADALLPDQHLLTLGISSTSSISATLISILSYFYLPWLEQPDSTFALPGFESLSSLNLKLDTSSGSRSSIGFFPDLMYTTWLRLRFSFDLGSIKDLLKSRFSFLKNFDINGAYLIGVQNSKCAAGRVQGTITSRVSLELDMTIDGEIKVQAWVIFNNQTTGFTIRINEDSSQPRSTHWAKSKQWLASVLGQSTDDIEPSGFLPSSENVSVTLHQISFTLSNPSATTPFALQAAAIQFEVLVFGATFSITLTWPNLALRASLWIEYAPQLQDYAIMPYIEVYDIFTPMNTPTASVDLGRVKKSSVPDPPPEMKLVPQLTEATFEAAILSSGQIQLQLRASLHTKAPDNMSGVPKLVLGELDFFALYTTQRGGFDISASSTMFLLPRTYPTDPASRFDIAVQYNSGGWSISGSAYDLNFGSLYQCFDADSQDSAMDILENFALRNLSVKWDYSKQSADLFVNGSLMMGPFELDLNYQYTSSPKEWSLDATLGASADSILLKDLLGSLGADSALLNALADVPFVNEIQIPAANVSDGSEPLVQLHVSKSSDSLVMWFEVAITSTDGTISLTFVQLHKGASKNGTANAAKPESTDVQSPPIKRIIRVMVDRLPTIPSIPVVGQIDQPIDSIDYLYVSDPTGTSSEASAGFKTSELESINQTMATATKPIPYRQVQSNVQNQNPPAGQSNSDPVALLPGHHFIVVADGVTIIDHLFGASSSASSSKIQSLHPPAALSLPIRTMSSAKAPGMLTHDPTAHGLVLGPNTSTIKASGKAVTLASSGSQSSSLLQADSGPTRGPAKKTFGPLTVTNVGLQTKNGYLYLLVDATIALGPIKLTLVGFGVGILMSQFKLNTIKQITPSDFSVILSGMSVYFDSPPVLIAGTFIKINTPTYEGYKGGLAVSVLPYTLLAVGEYQHTFNPDFKSVFIFARLDGPLLTLEFAEISGVELGFGYQYSLSVPLAGDIPQFPLVHGVTASNDPMDTLTQFDTWVSAAPDTVWFAAGMKVDSFDILSIDAAAIFQFGPHGFRISIVAIASASMPPKVPDPRESFLFVELGIVGTLDVSDGIFSVSAQLTPNSFVLYPDCHLTGGFALCYWFKGSPHEGDWVFTVGGYHPAFHPPDYYPSVPRLGINWNLNRYLTISGEAFFAITPKCCMGGGRLMCVFSLGPVYASLEAWASFLVNFKPFYFVGDIGVTVNAGFHIDIGLIHIHITGDIGATLHLEGPPFGGTVYVDLWIHTFSIDFGATNTAPGKLSWPKFLELVKQTRPDQQDPAMNTAADTMSLMVCSIVQGANTDKTTSSKAAPGDKWYVRAGSFQFRVETKFALDDMTYGDGLKSQSWAKTVEDSTTKSLLKPIYARQMQVLDSLSSNMTVTMVATIPPATDPAHDVENPWNVTPVIRQLPDGIWAQYNSAEDITNPNTPKDNSIGTLLDGQSSKTSSHLCGFYFNPPKPRLPAFNFPEFNATDAMQEGVFQDGLPRQSPRKNPLLPDGGDERPRLPPTPPSQTADIATARASDPWTVVENIWNPTDVTIAKAMDDTAKDLVQRWTDLMGWNNAMLLGGAAPGSDTFKPLISDRPAMIVGDFEDYFVGCPWITAASPSSFH